MGKTGLADALALTAWLVAYLFEAGWAIFLPSRHVGNLDWDFELHAQLKKQLDENMLRHLPQPLCTKAFITGRERFKLVSIFRCAVRVLIRAFGGVGYAGSTHPDRTVELVTDANAMLLGSRLSASTAPFCIFGDGSEATRLIAYAGFVLA